MKATGEKKKVKHFIIEKPETKPISKYFRLFRFLADISLITWWMFEWIPKAVIWVLYRIVSLIS